MQNKPYFFFWKQGFPKGGGGVRHLGKIPKKSRFFFGQRPLLNIFLHQTNDIDKLQILR